MAEARDCLFAGAVALSQLEAGHRVGTDAVLLAAAAPVQAAKLVVELGAGVGAVGLVLASRQADLHVVLVEQDPAAAGLARLNAVENGVSTRVSVVERDVLASWPDAPRADLVVTNPPWHAEGDARVSAERRMAHVMPEGGLDAWIKAALALLAPRGRLILVHRADALPAVLEALDRRFGAIAVRPVCPRDGDAATRVLVSATKGSRGPFRLLAPLALHGADGAFTPVAAALHRGDAVLDWD